jgi:hypothetical protein
MESGAHTWGLTAIAIATGAVLAWVWKRFTDAERLALEKRQARAQLYAMRLYADDPALILRAQAKLLLWTARYLKGMLLPAAVAIVPMAVLFVQLDSVYGHRPLGPGESAIVTARFGGGGDLRTPDATLEGRGVAVESAAVRIAGRGEVCWRVRALTPASGSVRLRVGGITATKEIQCGRWGRGWDAFRNGRPPIDIACPAATVDVLGYEVEWAVWFLPVSLLATLALGRLRAPSHL